jgi:hypothetical protein
LFAICYPSAEKEGSAVPTDDLERAREHWQKSVELSRDAAHKAKIAMVLLAISVVFQVLALIARLLAS